MGDTLAFIGLLLGLVGLVSLIRPIRRIGITSRAKGFGVLAGGFILLVVGANMAMPRPGSTSSNKPVASSSVPPIQNKPVASSSVPPVQQSSQPARIESGFGNGTHAVPSDVQPGTYRSTGRATCYWMRMAGFGGELNDIIANGNNAPEIVTIKARDAGFQTQGCGRWAPVKDTAPATPAAEFGDGTYAVAVHIAPGKYRSNGSGTCYWARLSDFGHELDGIIANGNNPTIVQIAQSDAGFTSFGCGSWSRLQ